MCMCENYGWGERFLPFFAVFGEPIRGEERGPTTHRAMAYAKYITVINYMAACKVYSIYFDVLLLLFLLLLVVRWYSWSRCRCFASSFIFSFFFGNFCWVKARVLRRPVNHALQVLTDFIFLFLRKKPIFFPPPDQLLFPRKQREQIVCVCVFFKHGVDASQIYVCRLMWHPGGLYLWRQGL